MEVKKQLETKVNEIYNTTTHQFKVAEEKVEELIINKEKLLTLIQKNMKQTVNNCSGEIWEESVRNIYKEITGEELVLM